MSKFLLAALVLIIVAWYLSFSATRLDRLHHRVETSWEHLDALLQRRASLALEIAYQSNLDPALDMLLTASAYESREAPMADRNEAERLLSESLRMIKQSASLGEMELKTPFIVELSEITEKIRVAISIHLEAVSAVENLRSKMIFRIFHLAGRAKLPFRYSFEDDQL